MYSSIPLTWYLSHGESESKPYYLMIIRMDNDISQTSFWFREVSCKISKDTKSVSANLNSWIFWNKLLCVLISIKTLKTWMLCHWRTAECQTLWLDCIVRDLDSSYCEQWIFSNLHLLHQWSFLFAQKIWNTLFQLVHRWLLDSQYSKLGLSRSRVSE